MSSSHFDTKNQNHSRRLVPTDQFPWFLVHKIIFEFFLKGVRPFIAVECHRLARGAPLTFHDAPSPIEIKLFLMFSKYRMRTFQGTFHANPDYAFWYGWSKMVQELTEIRAMADDLRQKARAKKKAAQ